DPLDLIDKFGADGLRFGIINIAPSGADIFFSEQRIEIGRNFCNKLWNACRFREMSGPRGDNKSLESIIVRIDPDQLDGYDHWILQRTLETTAHISRIFENYEMHQMTQSLYSFFWGDFCDWYVEASKAKLQDPKSAPTTLAVQDLVIRQTLLLLHPITPHITEELWQNLGYVGEGEHFIQDATVPSANALAAALAGRGVSVDEALARNTAELNELISRMRAVKAEYNLGTKRDVSFFYQADDARASIVEDARDTILRLAGG